MENNKKYISPIAYDVIAFVVGMALIGDLNVYEQNALGNWLMLIGQLLEANAAIQQNIENNIKGVDININSKTCKQGFSPFTENYIDKDTLKEVINYIDLLKEKLNDLNI